MYFCGTKSCVLIFCCFMSATVFGKDVKTVNAEGLRKPLCFVENKGQVLDDNNNQRKDIQYKLSAPGVSMYLGNGQLHYQFKKIDATPGAAEKTCTYSMDVTLLGANPQAKVIAAEPQAYYENYFTGATGNEGLTVHSFDKVTYQNVYPGIDWVLYVKDNNIEYDFVVRPGGDPHNIRVQYDGATALKLNENGAISAETPMGSVTEKKPYAFENITGKPVASGFKLSGNVVSFETGDYRGTLTIDPYLLFSTYFGGTVEDVVTSVKETTSGITFVGGYTSSSGLGTALAYKPIYTGTIYQAFLAKYSTTGALMFTTYFGGVGDIRCTGLVLDNTGAGNPNIFMAGNTSAIGLAPSGAVAGYHGLNDGFVAKFNNTGSGLIWYTYYGGTKNDYVYAITCDAANNVYITGQTASNTGINVGAVYQTTISGPTDAFVAKLSGAAGTVTWSTYYGGSADEKGLAIALDASNNVFITGQTNSIINVATPLAYQTVLSGTNDAFIAKLNSTGSTLVWGTYFGGTGQEQGNGIVCDPATGNVAVTGNTTSSGAIASSKAAQSIYGGGVQDAFVSYWTNSGNALWSTYLGGTSLDYGQGICLDNSGNVVITGGTFSSTGIASTLSFQNTIGGDYDAFLAKYNTQGQVLWATYFGGSLYDYGNAVACDNNNQLTVGGYTSSIGTYGTGGLSTAGSAQPSFAGGTYDGFVTKFRVDTVFQIVQPYIDTFICAGGTLNVDFISNFAFPPGSVLTVQLSDVAGTFTTVTPIGNLTTTIGMSSGTISCFIPALIATGTKYRIRINCNNPSYNSPDNFYDITIASGFPPTTATGSSPICVGATLFLNDVSPYEITSYSWTGPAGSGFGGTGFTAATANPINTGFSGLGVTLADAGTYSVTTTHNGCPSTTATVKITVNDVIPPTPTDSVALINCVGGSINLYSNPDTIAPGITYFWLFPSGVTSTLRNPVISSIALTDSGNYLSYDVLGGCASNIATIHVNVFPVTPVSIYITADPGDTICAGKTVDFSVKTVNEGATPHYQWMSGAFTPIVGANSPTFASSSLIDMETIFCVVSSSAICPSPVNASSNTIKFNVISNPPMAYISASPGTRVPGTIVVLRSVTYNGGSGATYQWKKNGVNITGATADTLAIPVLKENDTISLLVTSTMQCANPDTVISNIIIIGSNVGVANIAPSLENISLYPNPNNGTFTVKGDIENVGATAVSMELLNPIGQIIYKDQASVQNNSFSKTIDINNLADGIYLLHLFTNEQGKTIRFSVQH
jgi:type IX secretion system substrate protein